jgi:xylulokinase
VPLVLGVDSSTSACKVQVRDADTGVVVASGRAPHSPTSPPRSEQQPSEWERAFHEACNEAGVPRHHTAAAVAVAAQQHGLVVLGDDGNVLRPAKLSRIAAAWGLGRGETVEPDDRVDRAAIRAVYAEAALAAAGAP